MMTGDDDFPDRAPKLPGHAAAAVAACELSAGRRRPITAEQLVALLASGAVERPLQAHLCGFFEELPIEIVHDVALDEHLDYRRLLTLARRLGAEGETIEWLEEMAGDRVAPAA